MSAAPRQKPQEDCQEHGYDETAGDPAPKFGFNRHTELSEEFQDSGFTSLESYRQDC
jgi:hypothetical protein